MARYVRNTAGTIVPVKRRSTPSSRKVARKAKTARKSAQPSTRQPWFGNVVMDGQMKKKSVRRVG